MNKAIWIIILASLTGCATAILDAKPTTVTVGGQGADLGPIEATSCKRAAWDETPSAEAAIAKLQREASRLGATSISEPACKSEGVSIVSNCWASVSCTARALQ